MKTHLFNPNALPDELFTPGELKYLVIGNECRLLDKRRTPGTITGVDMDGGFFRWEISDFEDKGKYWDVAFERANTYQFKRDSSELVHTQVGQIEDRIRDLAQIISVTASTSEIANTNLRIQEQTDAILECLNDSSAFFKAAKGVDFQERNGPELLRADFNRYMTSVGLGEVERQTAEIQVMNPHSGDWIKSIQIVMAEMGLKIYCLAFFRSDF
jgi:hypothetical protein